MLSHEHLQSLTFKDPAFGELSSPRGEGETLLEDWVNMSRVYFEHIFMDLDTGSYIGMWWYVGLSENPRLFSPAVFQSLIRSVSSNML